MHRRSARTIRRDLRSRADACGRSSPRARRPECTARTRAPRRRAFALLGLRRPMADHSRAEGQLLRGHAAGRRALVGIGVAEGGSAWQLRSVMDPNGSLTLVDPFFPGLLFGASLARPIAVRL